MSKPAEKAEKTRKESARVRSKGDGHGSRDEFGLLACQVGDGGERETPVGDGTEVDGVGGARGEEAKVG